MEPKSPSHETSTSPDHAWLFDVDGVITNPIEKEITQPEILDELIRRLQAGDPIGLNSGRSIDFVVEQVLTPLEARLEDKSLLNKVIAVGEKGGVWITYKNGERQEYVDPKTRVPLELSETIRALIEDEFSETMFFDHTKKTMISVEMHKGESLDQFHQRQQELITRMKTIVEQMGLKDLKIDPTTIATDIENEYAGKALGARRYMQMLDKQGIKPKKFICFGDSSSDFEMFDAISESGREVQFVFVGRDTDRDAIRTQSLYDEGTLEYLQAH